MLRDIPFARLHTTGDLNKNVPSRLLFPINRRLVYPYILANCGQRERERKREIGVMKLYGTPGAPCTARVLLCLEEVGAEYELVTLSMPTGEHKGPAHLARNPFGQIPALEDGDLELFESRAISRYVVRKYKTKGSDLLKEGNLSESAMVDVWLEAEAQQYNPAISPIVLQSYILPKLRGATPDQAIIDTNLEKFKKVLEVYEARLSKSKYLAGDFFSLADLSHISYTTYLMATPYGSVFESYPHVKAWWNDITSRPAFKKVAAGMFGS